jgi:Ca2+-transporting ATPase
MTRPMDVPVFSGEPLWHTLATSQALEAAGVAEQRGLGSAEVAIRAERFGPNKFAEAKTEPAGARSAASTPT